MSLTTTSTTDVDQLFTPLALYHGKLVAVKRVTKRAAVQLTKPRLIELKQVSGADVIVIAAGLNLHVHLYIRYHDHPRDTDP